MEPMKVPDRWTFCAIIAVAAILGICCASGQKGHLKQTLFKRINVPSMKFQEAVTIEKFPIFSKVACLQQAEVRHWCHLASFSVDGICSLYDLSLPSNYQATEEDNTVTDLIKCYTDLPEGCVLNKKYHLEGNNVTGKCRTITCSNTTWFTTDGAIPLQDCSDGYESVPGVGCIKVVESGRLFEPAKEYCEGLGAQLVIPDDFEALRQFILCKYPAAHFTIGIKDTKWLDGRTVDTDVWAEEPTKGTSGCGYMKYRPTQDPNSLKVVHDGSCTVNYAFICQLPDVKND